MLHATTTPNTDVASHTMHTFGPELTILNAMDELVARGYTLKQVVAFVEVAWLAAGGLDYPIMQEVHDARI